MYIKPGESYLLAFIFISMEITWLVDRLPEVLAVVVLNQRFSYYWGDERICGFNIVESVTANLDHVT